MDILNSGQRLLLPAVSVVERGFQRVEFGVESLDVVFDGLLLGGSEDRIRAQLHRVALQLLELLLARRDHLQNVLKQNTSITLTFITQ